MALSDHFWQTLLLILLIQQIDICCINSCESHPLLHQSNDLNIFVGRHHDVISNQQDSNNFSYLKLHLPNKGLRFGKWNVNHLTSSKFEQIKLLLTTKSDCIDILFLTETFLKPSSCDSLYNIPGFTLLRKDRLHKAGGGIAVYCSNALTFNRCVDLEYHSVEILWLEICPFKSERSLLISGCYRPPSYSRDDDKLFDQGIETAYLTNKEVILTGDFNINFLSQEFKKHYLSKSLMNMHFSQLVSDVTRPSSGTCLDHIYTNKCQHITAALVENYALLIIYQRLLFVNISSSLNQLTLVIHDQ